MKRKSVISESRAIVENLWDSSVSFEAEDVEINREDQFFVGDYHSYSDSIRTPSSSTFSSSESENEIPGDINSQLAEWATKHLISRNALNELLAILGSAIPGLCKDSRTLKSTPKSVVPVEISGGQYIHYGIEDCLTDFLNSNRYDKDEIILDVNIDGLPISKSSKNQVWPILCNVVGTQNVMLIGVFGGNSKPGNFCEFLTPFVEEFKRLLDTGIYFRRKFFNVKIRAFILDAPARSSILKVKNHTGYYCCTKCCQKGKYVERRITFAFESCSIRTDQSFRNRSQEEHHNQIEPLVIEQLPIDCINNFPMDYMHVVCLGVMKTLMKLWINKKKEHFCLSNNKRVNLSTVLLNLKSKIPSEFCRTPRDLTEIDRWKATEFRQFLLYTGPFVLRDILNPTYYTHFLKLSIALRILLQRENCLENNVCAKELLESFIQCFPQLYSEKYLTYNFHCLIHLANDAILYGSIEHISAFKFENYLHILKKKVKKGNFVVTQIYNRLVESSINISPKKTNCFPKFNFNSSNLCVSVQTDSFKLSINNPDNYYIVGGEIFKIKSIHKNESNEGVLFGSKVENLENFFNEPIESSNLEIYFSRHLEVSVLEREHSLSSICKIVCLINSESNSHLFIPLIH